MKPRGQSELDDSVCVWVSLFFCLSFVFPPEHPTQRRPEVFCPPVVRVPRSRLHAALRARPELEYLPRPH